MHWIAAIVTVTLVVVLFEAVRSCASANARAEDQHNEDAW